MQKVIIALVISDDFDAVHALEVFNSALDFGSVQEILNDCDCDSCHEKDKEAPSPIISASAYLEEVDAEE